MHKETQRGIRACLLVLLIAFSADSSAGCAWWNSGGKQKIIDVASCFADTATTMVSNIVSLILQDGFRGVTPDWERAVDGLKSQANSNLPADVLCAISKAMAKTYNPPPGAALSREQADGVLARVRYLEQKLVTVTVAPPN